MRLLSKFILESNRMLKKIRGFIFTICSLLSVNLWACDFCMLGQGVNPYLTSNGRGITISEDYIESTQIYHGTNKADSHGKKEAWLIQTLTGFQSVSDDFTLMLSIPYTSKTNIDFDESADANPGTLTNGFGDMTLIGRYTFKKDHSLDSTLVVGALLGIKFPTGNTHILQNGSGVDRHALPGTGSFDEIAGLTASYAKADGYQLTGDITYNFAGRGRWNARNHQYGNSLNISMQGYNRLSSPELKDKSIFVFTGPKYEDVGKETGTQSDSGYQATMLNNSTGGSVGYWDVGIYAVFTPSVIVNASYEKAIYHYMNFNPDFDADPAEDYKTNFSVTFLY
jgi:hypothetical protein